MIREILIATIGIALIAAYPAQADDIEQGSVYVDKEEDSSPTETQMVPRDDYDRTGFYLGASGVYSYANFDNADDNSFGANLRIGYRGDRWVALELQSEWLKYDLDFGGRVDSVASTVNLRWFIPIGRVQPFFITGVGATYLRADAGGQTSWELDVTGRLGGGVEFYATRNLALILDASYMITADNDIVEDLNYLSVGLGMIYRF